MNPKNTKKSPIHENADANITCDFGDSDISRLGVAYLTHVIHTSLARLYYDNHFNQIHHLKMYSLFFRAEFL